MRQRPGCACWRLLGMFMGLAAASSACKPPNTDKKNQTAASAVVQPTDATIPSVEGMPAGSESLDLVRGNVCDDSVRGGPKNISSMTPWEDAGFWQTAQAGDFDGDGWMDYFGYSATGFPWVMTPRSQFTATGKTALFHLAWPKELPWPPSTRGVGKVVVGNFNRTAGVAILTPEGDWVVGSKMAESKQYVFSVARWSPTRWLGADSWRAVFATDLNNDGLTDVLAFNNDGSWFAGYSNGSTFTPVQVGQWSKSEKWPAVHVGDFNGDGFPDIWGLSDDNTWTVAYGTGKREPNKTFTVLMPGKAPTFGPGPWVKTFVADFNGDGRADVAGLHANGTWRVGLSTGSTLKVSTAATWTAAEQWRFVSTGDFNADGRTDIIGFNTVQNQWQVGLAAATGATFQSTVWSSGALPETSQAIIGRMNADRASDVWLAHPGTTRSIKPMLSVSTRFSSGVETWTDDVDVLAPGELNDAQHTQRWVPSFGSLNIFSKLSPAQVRATYFNSDLGYRRYVNGYRGKLRAWQLEFDLPDQPASAVYMAIGTRLNEFFASSIPALRAIYPGLSDDRYRALSIMNLVHGHLDYFSNVYSTCKSGAIDDQQELVDLLRFDFGDCDDMAELTRLLGKSVGLKIDRMNWYLDYTMPASTTRFAGGHAVNYFDGMTIDSQNNIAVDVGDLTVGGGPARLDNPPAGPLLNQVYNLRQTKRVYGFYNWFMRTPLRHIYTRIGSDATVNATFYSYYFEGRKLGNSQWPRFYTKPFP